MVPDCVPAVNLVFAHLTQASADRGSPAHSISHPLDHRLFGGSEEVDIGLLGRWRRTGIQEKSHMGDARLPPKVRHRQVPHAGGNDVKDYISVVTPRALSNSHRTCTHKSPMMDSMSTPVRIVGAGTSNLRDAAVETLVAAFAAEPSWSHALPNAGRRIMVLRAALSVLCGDAARRGTLTVALLDDHVVGASVGLAPGYHPSALRSPAYVWAAAEIVRHAGTASLHLWRRWRTLHAADPREKPHWHLAELGVRPDSQGRGVGRAMLDAFLIRVDERGAPATSKRTVRSSSHGMPPRASKCASDLS